MSRTPRSKWKGYGPSHPRPLSRALDDSRILLGLLPPTCTPGLHRHPRTEPRAPPRHTPLLLQPIQIPGWSFGPAKKIKEMELDLEEDQLFFHSAEQALDKEGQNIGKGADRPSPCPPFDNEDPALKSSALDTLYKGGGRGASVAAAPTAPPSDPFRAACLRSGLVRFPDVSDSCREKVKQPPKAAQELEQKDALHGRRPPRAGVCQLGGRQHVAEDRGQVGLVAEGLGLQGIGGGRAEWDEREGKRSMLGVSAAGELGRALALTACDACPLQAGFPGDPMEHFLVRDILERPGWTPQAARGFTHVNPPETAESDKPKDEAFVPGYCAKDKSWELAASFPGYQVREAGAFRVAEGGKGGGRGGGGGTECLASLLHGKDRLALTPPPRCPLQGTPPQVYGIVFNPFRNSSGTPGCEFLHYGVQHMKVYMKDEPAQDGSDGLWVKSTCSFGNDKVGTSASR